MVGETLVLDGDDGQLHGVGDAVAGHRKAALGVDPGDRITGRIRHRRHGGHIARHHLGGVLGGHVRGVVDHDGGAPGDREQQCGHQHPGKEAEQAHPRDGLPTGQRLLPLLLLLRHDRQTRGSG